MVERRNFSLTKVQAQDYSGKNYMGVYKKSSRNFNKFFDIFLPDAFEKKKNSKHELNSNIVQPFKDAIFFEEKKTTLFGTERDECIYNLNLSTKFCNLYPLYELRNDKYNFNWIRKISYFRDNIKLKSIFGKQTFLKESLRSQYIINDLFSEQEIQKLNLKFYSFFKCLFSVNFLQNTVSKKTVGKISKHIIKIPKLKNDIESDDIKIIGWKIRNYHSNFLLNYYLPFNIAYNITCQNSSTKKEIPLLEILNLLKLFFGFDKKISLISCIVLKEQMMMETKGLNRFVHQLTKVKDTNLCKDILSISGEGHNIYDDKNTVRNNYLIIKNLLDYNFHKYSSKSSKYSFFKLLSSSILYENKIFKKYWISRKKSFQHYDVEDDKYDKVNYKVYYWLSKIRNSPKKAVSYSFSIKLKLNYILKTFFWNSKFKNMDKISTLSQIFRKIHDIGVDKDNIYNKPLIKKPPFIQKNINDLIFDLLINGTNCKIIRGNLLTTFLTRNTINLDYIRDKNLLFNSNNGFLNFQLNYKRNFLFCCREKNVEDNSIIYLQFLKNFIESKNFKQNLIEKNFQLFPSRFKDEFGKTRCGHSSNFEDKISKQINFSFSKQSKKRLSKQVKNFISIKVFGEVETHEVSKDILVNLNIEKIGNYYNILRYESLRENIMKNSLLFQSMSPIFLTPIQKWPNLKNFKPKVEYDRLRKIDQVFKNFNQIEVFHSFNRDISVKGFDYKFWFFTSGWWEYSVHIFTETLKKCFVLIGSYSEYLVGKHIYLIQNNLINLYETEKTLYIFNSKWNSRLSFDHTRKIILNFVWSDFQLKNNWNNLYWSIISLTICILLVHENYFSIFIGSDPINLWRHFENIKYLNDNSRASYFTGLLDRNKTQLDKTENLFIYFFSNLKHYARNIQFYLITEKILNNWLQNNKNLDLSRRKRNLLVQSLITPTRIKEYGFQSYSQSKISNNNLFGYHTNSQEGLSYLRYVSRILNKNLVNYSVHRAGKWILFASVQKIIFSQTLQQAKHFNPKFQKIPIPLQLGLSCSKGILLIGPAETGRSYLMKNLASDSSVPLLGISTDKLMYNKPDVITESWMNILIESLRRLNLILDLAKGMSPCIIWIQNIHQLDVNRSTQNIESDPTFLLGILLKHFRTDDLGTRTKNNTIIIGSTHVPQKVDPSLISPDRLDRILNIRLFNTYQRKIKIPILLNRNNLQLDQNLLYLNELGSRTMGYNLRDLVALTNEISLINLTKNKSFVYDDSIKLAFNRQVLSFSHTNSKPDYQRSMQILLYKIGKAIVQNILIKGFAANPLNISNYLWKRKFYYLSKWYLEPSIDDSIIKESTILVHILGCLSGIAARDSWFLSKKDSKKSISLDKFVENDLDLAFSVLETFSSDFPWLETCENQFLTYVGRKTKIFSAKNFLNIMHNGIFAIADETITDTKHNLQDLLSENKTIERIMGEFNNTTWSPRFWRLNFCRSHVFNWIERPNDFEFFNTLAFPKKNNFGEKIHHEKLIDKKKEQLFYERILPRVRKRNVEELESQFENTLLEEQFEILGFFGSATQDQMEYQLKNKPRLFIGKRVVWDPIASSFQPRHSVFSTREFFVDEEMLRRLYITYGVRRERERSLSNHRIKRFFVNRGYNKDLINKLSVRWWNHLPIHQKQDIHLFKRIEKIGIRLKRPQIFTPVYLYQRWSIENIPGKFSRLDLLTHRDRWIKFNTVLLSDSLTYNIILESYQYLLDFFLSNKVLLNRMTRTLLERKWIFQNEIVDIMYSVKNFEKNRWT
jgi:hypothetical protein